MIFRLSDYGLTRETVSCVLQHFQNCKDAGLDNAFLMAMQDNTGQDILVLTSVNWDMEGVSDGERFGEEDYSEMLSEYDEIDNILEMGERMEKKRKDVFPIEPDDNIVMRDTRQWVQVS